MLWGGVQRPQTDEGVLIQFILIRFVCLHASRARDAALHLAYVGDELKGDRAYQLGSALQTHFQCLMGFGTQSSPPRMLIKMLINATQSCLKHQGRQAPLSKRPLLTMAAPCDCSNGCACV